jgi:hypothetical protein
MRVRICDKCKRQFGTFSEQAVQFPIVKVNVTRNYAACIHDNEFEKVDLCSNCQKAVYEFIFGKREKR